MSVRPTMQAYLKPKPKKIGKFPKSRAQTTRGKTIFIQPKNCYLVSWKTSSPTVMLEVLHFLSILKKNQQAKENEITYTRNCMSVVDSVREGGEWMKRNCFHSQVFKSHKHTHTKWKMCCKTSGKHKIKTWNIKILCENETLILYWNESHFHEWGS